MGRAIERAAEGMNDLAIVARVDRERCERDVGAAASAAAPARASGGTSGATSGGLGGVVRDGDVVVDFSAPAGFRAAAAVCLERRLPLVTGTTGLTPEDDRRLDDLARVAPALRAANFSLGVLALRQALRAALRALPTSWDIEIVERHHRAKVDSPSGTALTLARDAARERGVDDTAFRHGREGAAGPRPAGEIGLHAVRGGTWVGDHTVLLAGAQESLELRHVAEDRGAFAHGALQAARFLADAKPGRYDLEDMLRR